MVARITYADKVTGDLYTADDANLVKTVVNNLGTAADKNVGTASGQVPLLDASGKIAVSVLPDSVFAGGGAGTGDVIGPGSATDSRVALFNGTTGKSIKEGTSAQLVPITGDTTTYFLQTLSNVPTWVGPSALKTSLETLTTTNRLSYTAIKDLDVSAAGALYVPALIASIGLVAGQAVIVNAGATGFDPIDYEVTAPSTASSSGGSITLNFATVNVITTTTTEAITLTNSSVTNLATGSLGFWLVTHTTARNITFPSTWIVPSAFNPTLVGTGNSDTWISFFRKSSTVCVVTVSSAGIVVP